MFQARKRVCEYTGVGEHRKKPKRNERSDFDRRQLAHFSPDVGVIGARDFWNDEGKDENDDRE
ncbi:unannotated protein [freshwater metagenome]|uniref:Unannotated protein n=1 Tax=freshwater metagenome TaxID=449393 RepID=A0A6J6NCY9_9ZZZZ